MTAADIPEKTDYPKCATLWWGTMTSSDEADRKTSGARKAALAQLRHAANPLEILQVPAALELVWRITHKIEHLHLARRLEDQAAILAGILAYVREDNSAHPVARAIGRKSLGDKESALMSESRFRRLLQTPPEDLLDPMRRLVRLSKDKVNVYDLADAILNWESERVKRCWIFNYYGVFGAKESGLDQPPAASDDVSAPQTSPAS